MKTEPSAGTAADEAPVEGTLWKDGRVPEAEAFFLSRWFFFWAQPLFRRAAQLAKRGEALEQDDLLPMMEQDLSHVVGQAFEKAWNESAPPAASAKTAAPTTADLMNDPDAQSTARISRVIGQVLGPRFIFAGFVKFFNSGLQFTFPLLLNAILKFIEETTSGEIGDDDPWYDQYRGYWLAAILFVGMAMKAVVENYYFHTVYRGGYQARVAVSVAVYNKALRLSNAARQGTTLGELVNLMQVDATKIEAFIPQFHVLWDGAVQIIGYMAILYSLIGWPCFAGLVLMIVAGPIQGVIMKKLFGMNRKMVKYTDDRVKTTNEALQGIQSVKMYTWEESFEQSITKSRKEELVFFKAIAYLRGFSRAYMGALPGMVAVASFAVYSLAVKGSTVDASTLFSALVAFDQLRFPLLFYPMSLAQLAQAKVSASRVETFLSLREVGHGEESSTGTYKRNEENGKGEIVIKDATVFWNDQPDAHHHDSDTDSVATGTSSLKSGTEESGAEMGEPEPKAAKPILRDINLRVAHGELCAVVGRVASGKSTLCSAVLNETLLKNGEITLSGQVAYAAQTPFILNATLRENILFGLPMDERKYQRVIKACQLTHDLEMLEYGDQTEIGEKGINLSGGQKQRVSVARAAYSDANVIILDDPLSALDPEVGKQLFHDCILDLMKGKTRLLITNQLQFLNSCDKVVVLRKGEVLDQGTFAEIKESTVGGVRRFLGDLEAKKEKSAKSEDEEKSKDDGNNGGDATTKAKDGNEVGGLVTKEERNVGAVSLEVYKKYIAAGGGYVKFAFLYFAFVLTAANGLANNAWVSYWTSDASYENNTEAFYLSLYFALAVSLGLVTYLRSYLLARFCVNASDELHMNLLASILAAPQSFFDQTPVGRILSRFSKDLYSIDLELNEYFDFFLFCSLTVFTSIGTILYVTPWFGVAVVPLGVLYFWVMNYFRDVSRETKRLESVSRSPVYAHFSETLGGLATIRAFNDAQRFEDRFEERVNENTRAFYCNKAADRWLSVRLEIIGASIAGLAAFFSANVAISNGATAQSDTSNFASLAGLSLSFAISVTGLLNWCVRSFAQLEAGMNACERVLYYTENIPQEAARTSDQLKPGSPPDPSDPSAYAVAVTGGKAITTPSGWPDKGEITLKDLRMRYHADTPLVLRGLNVLIQGGERVGVVGRTGSGKSSLLLSLLRIVEPYLEEGSYAPPVSIDGVDTLRIGLRDLRSKLGIIPQSPVLFSGTIRSNVDPFDEYSDEQIWDALERCGMKESVEAMPEQLNGVVAEYGENLSAGMRQLLVLGRALLRQCRILLLDEATSSVDYETDREIQRTLREAFVGCTILTIAHRINTIMDSDKILVMKDGLVAEFASPKELLDDPTSVFSEIVRHSESEN